MKNTITTSLLAATVAAYGLVSVAISPAQAQSSIPFMHEESKSFVSFGDSYASNSVTPRGSGSEFSAPRLAANKVGMGDSFGDYAVSASLAASGTTGLINQVSLAVASGALTEQTRVVTISSGGNDAIGGLHSSGDSLSASLHSSIGTAVSMIRQASPSAQIILVGYPEVTLGGICVFHTTPNGLMTKVRVGGSLEAMAQSKEVELNDRQRQVSNQLGIDFVDAKDPTFGHGLCNDDNPYISRLIDTRDIGATMPLHVTMAGNDAMSTLIAGHVSN